MSWLRVKVGCWLLGPLLRAELRLAGEQQASSTGLERRYWAGRHTGALRLYQALGTREDHLAARGQDGEEPRHG